MTESDLHLAMKDWVVDKYNSEGVSLSSIELEKKYSAERKDNKLTWTWADVFIDVDGGIAIYCQTHNDYPWLYDFLEKRLPLLRMNCEKQIVVFPQNLEMLFPVRFQECYKQLKKENVDVMIAPLDVGIENKSKVRIDMTYKALQKLCNLKNSYSPDKTLMDFIEKDLEKLINQRKQMGVCKN